MQSTLLHILILGLLVLLFGVMYRKRATPRLRFWIAGWLFTLFHFAVLLPTFHSDSWQSLQLGAGMGALFITGICFVLASLAYELSRKQLALLAGLIGIPALTYLFLTFRGVSSRPLLIGFVVFGEAVALFSERHFSQKSSLVFAGNILSALLCGGWMVRLILLDKSEYGIYAILTQIFFMNAVLFYNDFRRISAGVLTSVGGLLTWAAVFPVVFALDRYFPSFHPPIELWNVPKYFVEFGMILTLLENQVYSANWQREQYRLLFDNNPHPMYIYDTKTHCFLRVNNAALNLYGYSRHEFLSRTVQDLQDMAATPGIDLLLSDAHRELEATGPWKQRRKDGTEFQAEISSHSLEFESRAARFSMVRDITDRQRLHEQLLHQAHHDSLTNLPNRVLLEQRMRHTLENASRYDHKAAVICIDLDRFKHINDTYGHGAGDACLQEIANRLTHRLRESDTIARTGGEEFTVVVGELLFREDAEKVARDLLACFQRPISISSVELELSASIGVALYPDHGTEGKELWRAADLIMYRAKFSGGNRYMVAELVQAAD